MTKHEAWEKLIDNVSLKRCLEVALTGGHNITVVGNPDNGLEYLQIILGDLLTFQKPCKCGNFKDLKMECICNSDDIIEIRKTQKYQRAMNNDLIIKVEYPSSLYFDKSREDFESLINRIAQTTEYSEINNYNDKDFDLVESAQDLFKVAISKLSLTLGQIERIKSVAKTIAIMDRTNFIAPYHISEAVQYQILRKEL